MRFFSLWCFFLSTTSLYAQPALNTKSKKAIELYTTADNFRVRGQYKEAIDLLKQAVEKDGRFAEAYYRLGQTYKSLKQYTLAIENFNAGLSYIKEERAKRTYWFEMGEAYFALGQYEMSKDFLTDYIKQEVPSVQNKGRFDQAKKLLESVDFAQQNKNLAIRFKQQPLSDTVNCFELQYFPVLTADQQSLIFTRRIGNRSSDDEDIVISHKDAYGKWTSPVSISREINSSLNEGTSAISADGRKLIFTSCVGRNGWGSCDLYESIKTGEIWSLPKNLGPNVNSPDWESQPSLSADGRTLYFVSDRRGGQGRRDIWLSNLDAKGNWTRARNLGKEVNTVYDEISPFIHVNNRTLYFASNGLAGFGGYDIYYKERDESGKWTETINMGAPINTHEDQFSLFVTSDGVKAYYSHETINELGQSLSRLYETLIPENRQPIQSSRYVRGVIRDKDTKRPLRSSIELMNIERDTLEALTQSDSISGEYLMVLTKGSQYALYINKEAYLFQSLYFDYRAQNNDSAVVIDVDLQRIKSGTKTILNNLFFEFDKYTLQSSSFAELDKIVRFLQENPTLSIEISGHTDNIGSEVYNQELSQKRAQEVAKYLLGKKINPKRVSSKGFGSKKPIASNDIESGQKLNRRIEFTVL